MAIFATAGSRLIVRALLAGLMAGLLWVQQHGTTHGVVLGAVTAGAWAAVEYLTPVNASVGVGAKQP